MGWNGNVHIDSYHVSPVDRSFLRCPHEIPCNCAVIPPHLCLWTLYIWFWVGCLFLACKDLHVGLILICGNVDELWGQALVGFLTENRYHFSHLVFIFCTLLSYVTNSVPGSVMQAIAGFHQGPGPYCVLLFSWCSWCPTGTVNPLCVCTTAMWRCLWLKMGPNLVCT